MRLFDIRQLVHAPRAVVFVAAYVALSIAIAAHAQVAPDGAGGFDASPPSVGTPAAAAQPSPSTPRKSGAETRWDALRRTANANTIYLMAGAPTGTAVALANDIALVLDDGPVRVLPVIGKGASQNVQDVLLLRGIDLGLTFADTLEILSESGELRNLRDQIRYLGVFAVSDVHVIAPRSVARFEDLAGKTVAADVAGSGSNLSARYVFSRLKMDVDVRDVDFARSLDLLQRGEIDAIYKTEVRPNAALAELRGDLAANLHLVPVPFDPRLSRAYQPSIVPAGSYPDLADGSMATIASPMVLISYNWAQGTDRYARVATFATALFDSFAELQQSGRHPSWLDVNIAADYPGWRRFQASEDWIAARRDASAATIVPEGEAGAEMREAFAAFLDARGADGLSAAERDALFEQFQTWMKSKGR